MIKIGIVGNESSVYIERIVFTLLSLTNLKVITVSAEDYIEKKSALLSEDAVIIVNINSVGINIVEKFNILILNAENNYIYQNQIVSLQDSVDYLILDADQLEVINHFDSVRANLITCGFNQKACITTSSIISSEYETILVCIQRAFRSINNKYIDQQEFSVDIMPFGDNNIFNILSAIACVLICGVKIESISE